PRPLLRSPPTPPFAVTTAILRRLLHQGSRLQSAHLVLNVDVARRWASPHAPGAGRWQRAVDPRLGARRVQRGGRPAPRRPRPAAGVHPCASRRLPPAAPRAPLIVRDPRPRR